MNANRQQGFTLIELMITIAITAISGAVAIPAYQDYTARAQVSEGFSLVDGVKTSIVDAWNNTGVFVTANSANGVIPSPSSISGKYVRQVAVTNGIISVMMRSAGSVAGPIGNKTFTITPSTTSGSLNWTCTTGGSIALKYLPKSCTS